MKQLLVLITIVISLNTTFSQNFVRGISDTEFDEIIMEDYKITKSELDSYKQKLPEISDERFEKFNSDLSWNVYIQSRIGPDYYGSITFMRQFFALLETEMYDNRPPAPSKSDKIIFSLFWHKYQEKINVVFTDKISVLFENGLYDIFIGKELDVFKLCILFDLYYSEKDLSNLYYIESILDFAWDDTYCRPDINYAALFNNKLMTTMDFLDYCEENIDFDDDILDEINEWKVELVEYDDGKRYRNMISGNDEVEMEVVKANEVALEQEFNDIILARKRKLNIKYSSYLSDNESPEYYFYKSRIDFESHSSYLWSGINSIETSESAIQNANKAISLAPQQQAYRYYKALELYRLNKVSEALEEMNHIVKATDTASVIYYSMAEIYYEQKKYDEAVIAINKAKKYKTNQHFENLYKNSIKMAYPKYMEYSEIKVKELFKINYPVNKYDEYSILSITQERICLVAYLKDPDEFWNYIIYDTKGRVVKEPSDNLDLFNSNEVIPKYENDVIPAKIHSENERESILTRIPYLQKVYLDLNGNILKKLPLEPHSESYVDHITSFHYGFSVIYDYSDERIIIYDEDFAEIKHSFTNPYPIGDGVFIDKYNFHEPGMGDPPNPKAFKSLDGKINTEYIYTADARINDTWYSFELHSEWQNKMRSTGLISIETGKIISPRYKYIYHHLGENEKYIYATTPDHFYLLNKRSGEVVSKRNKYAIDNYKDNIMPLGNNFLLIDDARVETSDGEVVLSENYFEDIGFFHEYGIAMVEYYNGFAKPTSQGLVDAKFRKIQLPDNIKEIVSILKEFILVEYKDGSFGFLQIIN